MPMNNRNSSYISSPADKVAQGLKYLKRAHPQLNTPENINLLNIHASYADNIGRGICLLSLADSRLATQENFNLLITHASHADKIAAVLDPLNTVYPHLVTQENFDLLIANAPYADKIAQGLGHLASGSLLGFFEPEDFVRLVLHAPYADKLGSGLAQLDRVKLRSQENINLLVNNLAHADKIPSAIFILSGPSLKDKMPNNINLVFSHAAHAKKIVEVMGLLKNAHPSLDTQENFDLLIAHAPYADKLAQGLDHFQSMDVMGRKITQENFDLLIAHAAYANKLAQAICQLSWVRVPSQRLYGIDTPENIQVLIQNKDFINKFLVKIRSQDHFNQIKNGIEDENINERKVAFFASLYERRRRPDGSKDTDNPNVIERFKLRVNLPDEIAEKILSYLPRFRP